MHTIDAINVNDAYAQGLRLLAPLALEGEIAASRYGEVIEYDRPVTTLYRKPYERVLWDAKRDCNPFFHFFESLWMLAGRNDVEFVALFAKKMAGFSDNGDTFHGAYGYRWMHTWEFNQLDAIVELMRKEPTTRRAVLGMWNPSEDLLDYDGNLVQSKDLPCNMLIKFEMRHKRGLDMMVFNRSNDAIWGAYGANAVHMSVLHEYMAARIGTCVGWYWQVSGNFHAYTSVWNEKVPASLEFDRDRYADGDVFPMPLFDELENPDGFQDALRAWFAEFSLRGRITSKFNFRILDTLATPLLDVWLHWKRKERAEALVVLNRLPQGVDWTRACRQWMERRVLK